jgi:hypothetical protein
LSLLYSLFSQIYWTIQACVQALKSLELIKI